MFHNLNIIFDPLMNILVSYATIS